MMRSPSTAPRRGAVSAAVEKVAYLIVSTDTIWHGLRAEYLGPADTRQHLERPGATLVRARGVRPQRRSRLAGAVCGGRRGDLLLHRATALTAARNPTGLAGRVYSADAAMPVQSSGRGAGGGGRRAPRCRGW